ncbi:MAG: hypothetical protein M3Q07_18070, partial [Pseudobdellovibrionaceae bacterium]|nr:hypothetical protein [Pseudobdellovibrionaceae bacterium]
LYGWYLDSMGRYGLFGAPDKLRYESDSGNVYVIEFEPGNNHQLRQLSFRQAPSGQEETCSDLRVVPATEVNLAKETAWAPLPGSRIDPATASPADQLCIDEITRKIDYQLGFWNEYFWAPGCGWCEFLKQEIPAENKVVWHTKLQLSFFASDHQGSYMWWKTEHPVGMDTLSCPVEQAYLLRSRPVVIPPSLQWRFPAG